MGSMAPCTWDGYTPVRALPFCTACLAPSQHMDCRSDTSPTRTRWRHWRMVEEQLGAPQSSSKNARWQQSSLILLGTFGRRGTDGFSSTRNDCQQTSCTKSRRKFKLEGWPVEGQSYPSFLMLDFSFSLLLGSSSAILFYIILNL